MQHRRAAALLILVCLLATSCDASSSTGDGGTDSTGGSAETTSEVSGAASVGGVTTSQGDSGSSVTAATGPTNGSEDTTASGTTGSVAESGGLWESTGVDGDGSSSSGPGAQNNSPVILVASTNTGAITWDDTVAFVVVATDADGIEDLIGGTITTPEGGTYAALITAAEEGTYEAEVSWDDINTTSSIDIDPYETEDRAFLVTIFDQSGASAEATLEVELSSPQEDWAVCAGEPSDLGWDETCGHCDFSCLDPVSAAYGAGGCIDDDGLQYCGAGTSLTIDDPTVSCNEACEDLAGPQIPAAYGENCTVIGDNCGVGGISCSQSMNTLQDPACGSGATLQCFCLAFWEHPS